MNDIQSGDVIPQLKETADGGAELVYGKHKLNVDPHGKFRVDSDGNTLEQVDGGVIITRPSGFKAKMLDGGGIEFYTKPKSVGIHDLSQVASFGINVEGTTSTHTVVFKNGDTAQVIYKDGVFDDLVSSRLGHYLNSSDELFIGQSRKDSL